MPALLFFSLLSGQLICIYLLDGGRKEFKGDMAGRINVCVGGVVRRIVIKCEIWLWKRERSLWRHGKTEGPWWERSESVDVSVALQPLSMKGCIWWRHLRFSFYDRYLTQNNLWRRLFFGQVSKSHHLLLIFLARFNRDLNILINYSVLSFCSKEHLKMELIIML